MVACDERLTLVALFTGVVMVTDEAAVVDAQVTVPKTRSGVVLATDPSLSAW